MAAQSVGENNKQLWDEALTRLLDLSTATVKRNTDLEERVAELEAELAIWKQAHNALRDSADRDKKVHNMQVATLNTQLATSDFIKTQSPLILCFIDGNANTFSRAIVSQGQQGGREAAKELTKAIAEYLSPENVQVFGRLSFWITIYVNRDKLLDTAVGADLCTPEQLNAFLDGFTQASPRFLVIESGSGPDSVDAKIRESLQTYTRFPQTLRVFLGAGFDGGLNATLASLSKEDLLGKLVLLQGCNDPCTELRQMSLPTLQIDRLFAVPKISKNGRHPGPIVLPPPGLGTVTTNGGLISPQDSEGSRYSLNTSAPIRGQLIDPTKGSSCKYSHDWLLTPEQLDTLSKNAKKAPCNYLKNGQECPYGDSCCWGHVCPSGPKCFHLSKGKCWFKGENMHAVSFEDA
ncbi:hypothetical protein C8Q75DRAFT_199448 [Abortiporus biennis]|nr:hypothetical protein C8Q75DRAFT_199448 [Abortiporus biennis]